MSKLKFLLLLVVGCLMMVACSNGEKETVTTNATPSNDNEGGLEEVNARLAHSYPVELFVSKGYEKFAELAKEKSGGKINISIFPTGQLYLDVNMPDAVTTGQVEFGVNTLEMWTSHVPSAEFSVLPIFNDYDHVHNTFNTGLHDLFVEEFTKVGARPIMWSDFGYAYYASVDEALSSPDLFEGKKVRTTSPLMAKYVELAGGSPVTLSGEEVVQGLQRGTVDAALSGVAGFTARQYYEFTNKYSGPFNAGIVSLTVNDAFWNGLSKEAQDILLEAAKEAQEWTSAEQLKVHEESIKILEQEGMVYEELNKDAFSEIEQQVIDVYLDKTGEVGQKVIDIINSAK
ncbi:TRAP transporter substrate-binding protein DctP [Lysinibacillus sp. BW-2-10]|uniref:TRAP transporter substrate-binding protein DctP n=1 Tax=Lysinibacillus sp. BW-2-10 TaxID=2590030 RepID=UPI00117EC7C9|nr:TRAP transporter substrate-binding protein DctP [Lysinibacillus sp. BW-2-10]TSI08984.1 hypothetical protein FJQ64_05445 [Lysinibacillus sp. BW-2-10]